MKNLKLIAIAVAGVLLSGMVSADEADRYVKDLASKDRAARTKAIIMLGNLKHLGAISQLVSIMKNDPSLDIKGQAVTALGKIGDESIVPPMIGLLNTTGEISLIRQIIAILAKYPREDVKNALVGFASHDSPVVRRETVLAMTAINDAVFVSAVRNELADLSSDARIAAIDYFTALKSTAALNEILEMASGDRVKGVRLAAIAAAGHIGGNASKKCLPTLLKDKDVEITLQAASSLGMLGDNSGFGCAARALKAAEVKVRLAAIRALGNIKTQKSKKELLKLKKSGDEKARAAAEEALEKIGR